MEDKQLIFPPYPFSTEPWQQWQSKNNYQHALALCWFLDRSYRKCFYLFNPYWDGGWAGKGHWRIATHGTSTCSPCYDTPEKLWAWWISFKMTGEWR